jgi:hypothetical protein
MIHLSTKSCAVEKKLYLREKLPESVSVRAYYHVAAANLQGGTLAANAMEKQELTALAPLRYTPPRS